MSEEKKKLKIPSYYYSFDVTGCDPVDEILSAVASASAMYHHTEYWNNSDFCNDGLSPVDRIQNAANQAASLFNSQITQKPECNFDCELPFEDRDCDICQYQPPF